MSDGSPIDALRSSTRMLVHDAIELADLQLQLFAADGQEMARKATPLLVIAAIGVTIAFSSLPLLLMALAYALVELAGLPIWLAMLSSAVVGMVLGGVAVLISIRRLQPHLTIWKRSAAELRENVDFLKATLRRPEPHEHGPDNGTSAEETEC